MTTNSQNYAFVHILNQPCFFPNGKERIKTLSRSFYFLPSFSRCFPQQETWSLIFFFHDVHQTRHCYNTLQLCLTGATCCPSTSINKRQHARAPSVLRTMFSTSRHKKKVGHNPIQCLSLKGHTCMITKTKQCVRKCGLLTLGRRFINPGFNSAACRSW